MKARQKASHARRSNATDGGPVETVARRTPRAWSDASGPGGSRAAPLRRALLGSAAAPPLALLAEPDTARAAPPPFVNVCTGLGVTLPVLQPVAAVTDGLLGGVVDDVLGPVIGNVNVNLQQALSGRTLEVGVIDPATGTLVTVPGGCNPTVNALRVDNALGLSLGGGVITGLGGTTGLPAVAGSVDAIALGDGAVTGPAAFGAVALGTGAVATGAGSVALGAGSTDGGAARVVSLGAPGAERRLTNVAAGTAATDAATVGQVRGAGVALGSSLGASLGGGAAYDAATGTVSAPRYAVGGTIYGSVGGALAALDAGVGAAPVKHSTPGAPTVANPGVPSNDATLVGAGGTVALHNLAGGSAATDAATVGQVAVGTASVAAIIGGGATYDAATNRVTDPSYTVQGTSYTTIGGALNALQSSVNGVGNQRYFQANSALPEAQATAADAVAIGPLAVASGLAAVALGRDAAATGAGSVAIGAGSTDGGQAGVASVGAAGAERRITNVAAGTLSATSADAVTGAQLYRTDAQVASLGRSTVRYDTGAAGGILSSVTLSSEAGGPVVIHNLAPGAAASDAATVGQVQASAADGVRYTVTNGVRSNTVALAGGAPGGVTIANVAAGMAPDDAVNVAQLQTAAAGAMGQSMAYTDQRISTLSAFTRREIDRARADAAGGTALALAATGLRYADLPGKVSVAGATAYYHDQMGLAFGVGATSEDGRFRVNAALGAAPTLARPDVGAVVGVSMVLN